MVTNTIFKHRDCHKFTWFHPGDSSKAGHVIDFILVNRKFRNSILDSRVYRGTHLQSNHSKIRVKLKVMNKRKKVLKPVYVVNPKSLSKNQCEAYEKIVKDEMSECEMYDMEQAWSTLRKVLLEAQRVLTIKVEQKSGDWVTEDVCMISHDKRRAWLTWRNNPRNNPLVMSFRMEYMRLKALSKRKVAEAKEKWSEQVKLIGDAFENGLRNGKSGSVLKDLKRLRNSSHTSVIVNKNGSKLLSTKEQLVRRREYFEELLNVSC